MRLIITGSARHLGEGLARALSAEGHEIIGLDPLPSLFTGAGGSVAHRDWSTRAFAATKAVLHAAPLPSVQEVEDVLALSDFVGFSAQASSSTIASTAGSATHGAARRRRV